MDTPEQTPEDVVSFWREVGAGRWFKKDPVLDEEVRRRFLRLSEAAAAGRLDGWQQSPEGALALLILLDQFPRNLFRDSARAFETDPKARAVASRAILNGFDAGFDEMRTFFYLPFMHSENLADQERAVTFYRTQGNADGLKWAELHADIIRRFGRFPHRNAALGRTTTPAERTFLDSGGFGG